MPVKANSLQATKSQEVPRQRPEVGASTLSSSSPPASTRLGVPVPASEDTKLRSPVKRRLSSKSPRKESPRSKKRREKAEREESEKGKGKDKSGEKEDQGETGQ